MKGSSLVGLRGLGMRSVSGAPALGSFSASGALDESRYGFSGCWFETVDLQGSLASHKLHVHQDKTTVS